MPRYHLEKLYFALNYRLLRDFAAELYLSHRCDFFSLHASGCSQKMTARNYSEAHSLILLRWESRRMYEFSCWWFVGFQVYLYCTLDYLPVLKFVHRIFIKWRFTNFFSAWVVSQEHYLISERVFPTERYAQLPPSPLK